MALENAGPARRIVVDWGTSSFRAALIDETSGVVDTIETDEGISRFERAEFEPLLMLRLDAWFAAHGPLPVVCVGMITSRNGWVEIPYVSCPATPVDLARGARTLALPNGAPVTFIGGLSDPSGDPFPDVMRGEETQIVGFGLERDVTLVLPGTHSKWARLRHGRIAGFRTFVTGEVYALLSQHSFIARGAGIPSGEPAWAAFDRAAATVAASIEAPRAFLADIFSARTGLLAGELSPSDIPDYVSGLVIGHEFREACHGGGLDAGGSIGIIGSDALSARYGRVARAFGLEIVAGGEQAAIKGALAIADLLEGETR